MIDRFQRGLRFLIFAFALGCPKQLLAADYSFHLNNVRIVDLTRIVYGDVLHRSFILDDEFIRSTEMVTVSWDRVQKFNLDSMMMELLNRRGFETDKIGRIMLVRKRQDDDQDMLVYLPRNRAAKYLADIIQKVAGVQQLGTRGMTSSPAFQQAAQKVGNDQGTALGQMDRSALDQMAYACNPAQCGRLRRLLHDLDTPEPQVMVRAVLYEVGTSKGEGSAVQLAVSLLKGKLTLRAGALLSGADSITLSTGLESVISILDQDSRFKVVSRPTLRVKTGAQARFSVGQQVPVLGAITQDKNGTAQQSVEYRQSGTIFTVQPDIRQDVVDLNITQELSSFVETTTGVNNSPTLLQRTASSQFSVNPGEVVIFAGLEESREDHAQTGLFGFTTSKKNSTSGSELLLFIEATPI